MSSKKSKLSYERVEEEVQHRHPNDDSRNHRRIGTLFRTFQARVCGSKIACLSVVVVVLCIVLALSISPDHDNVLNTDISSQSHASSTSFTQPAKREKVVKNQFIIQYKDSKYFYDAKQNKALSTHNGKVVKYIDSRNVEVIKFSSKKSANKWFEKNTEKIKYFEEGELYDIWQ